MIKEMQRNAAFMRPDKSRSPPGRRAGAGDAVAAANQGAGSAMAFMGMNMAGQAGGMNAQNLYQMGAQQQSQQQRAGRPRSSGSRLDVQLRQDRQHRQILRRVRKPQARFRHVDVRLRRGK